jgi:hypothetical protein
MKLLALVFVLGLVSSAAFSQESNAPAQKKKTENAATLINHRTMEPTEAPDRKRLQKPASHNLKNLDQRQAPEQKRTSQEPKKEDTTK